jgi:TRAP-type C4-dicarboxylate transport system substrate-binding protein
MSREQGFMKLLSQRHFLGYAAAAAMMILLPTLMLGTARAQDKVQDKAQDKTSVMKITLPAVSDPSHLFAKNYAAAIERDSGGRIKTEVYPASQLGAIPRQIEGTQFGAIQCAIIPPEFFVGIDERFAVLAAPGVVDSVEHAHRLTLDPATLKLILALGADKGLHGAGLFLNGMSSVIATKPIRHVSDFKGKKIRTLASKFQTEPFNRLGATPVVMTLGDVLPALQQGTLDGSVGSVVIFTPMHFQEAAKYLTETGQPPVFVVVEISKRWYDALPADLQKIVDGDAAKEAVALHPHMVEMYNNARKGWSDAGGELISLPPDEQTMMMKTLSSVGADVSSSNPTLSAAYKAVTAGAERTR